MNIWIEIIGIVATLLILASMCFKTLTFKGSVWMRAVNIAGSIVFVVYGSLLPAISTAILNGLLVIVNSYHLYILVRDNKRAKAKESAGAEENKVEKL